MNPHPILYGASKMSIHPPIVEELRSLVDIIVEASDLSSRVTMHLEKTRVNGRKILIAFGKGASSMAEGAVKALGEPDGGVIVIPKGHARPRIPNVEVIESTHPIPSEKSIEAGDAVLEWAAQAGGDDSLIVLISGGGSALVEKPLENVELEDIIELNKLMLTSGMSILEINTIRKHLSQIKGGRLAQKAYPTRLHGLYASDVPGDRLDLIASGPTVPDPSTFQDAIEYLKRWGLWNKTPKRIRETLEKGASGLIPETPKPGNKVFERVDNKLIAANIDVLQTLAKHLQEKGYNTLILTSRIEGESREVAKALAAIALEARQRGIPLPPPAAILVGGETTVKVRGKGLGGRNMELALAWALTIDYWLLDTLPPGTLGILAMDTDGIDGVTDAAGAIMYNGITIKARREGLNPDEYLEENNTYEFARQTNLLIKTGPTGSNLNSLAIILIKQ